MHKHKKGLKSLSYVSVPLFTPSISNGMIQQKTISSKLQTNCAKGLKCYVVFITHLAPCEYIHSSKRLIERAIFALCVRIELTQRKIPHFAAACPQINLTLLDIQSCSGYWAWVGKSVPEPAILSWYGQPRFFFARVPVFFSCMGMAAVIVCLLHKKKHKPTTREILADFASPSQSLQVAYAD